MGYDVRKKGSIFDDEEIAFPTRGGVIRAVRITKRRSFRRKEERLVAALQYIIYRRGEKDVDDRLNGVIRQRRQSIRK